VQRRPKSVVDGVDLDAAVSEQRQNDRVRIRVGNSLKKGKMYSDVILDGHTALRTQVQRSPSFVVVPIDNIRVGLDEDLDCFGRRRVGGAALADSGSLAARCPVKRCLSFNVGKGHAGAVLQQKAHRFVITLEKGFILLFQRRNF
jgi:hypothetical protein